IDEGNYFPADFIAEGVDQTRGWFFTLHAIATMCFDSVAYKNVVSNGLVLDKNGQKMSKRLGNAVNPFETLAKYGADATRWYMISNAQPWDNLRFDENGITEVQRKFFGTLYNTYSFFGLYANIDEFGYAEPDIPLSERRELDRWILSKLNSLIKEVGGYYSDYEPTRAARAIQNFTLDDLSNWYVRLSRRIFWKGEYAGEKIAAYQTLYRCLEVISILSSPIAPFYSDQLYRDLTRVSGRSDHDSVHLAHFPKVDESSIDIDLEKRMDLAQRISSLVLSLRKKERLKVRQPLQRIMIPVMDDKMAKRISAVSDLIKSEVNVKEIELLEADNDRIIKEAKANFKLLGKRFGKQMKAVAASIKLMDDSKIAMLEREGKVLLDIEGGSVEFNREEIELTSQDIPGWSVAVDKEITVALDISLSESLIEEGLARELVNKVQNFRKELDFEVTDRIDVALLSHKSIDPAIIANKNYICSEILAESLEIVDDLSIGEPLEVSLSEDLSTRMTIIRSNS
ncbi:MAG: class I tRNA ligase family protein, partial [Flavobacteriales bacterium]|nr:class I tRNA ligase family protein [Flavobacteriales bacterium]